MVAPAVYTSLALFLFSALGPLANLGIGARGVLAGEGSGPAGATSSAQSANYSCDATCASTSPPGGLKGSDVPQFITVTADDALEIFTTEAINHMLAQRKNPNGCTPKATWFLSLNYTNYSMVTDFYVAGNEIADHTMTHVGSPSSAEILGNLKAVNAYSGIPVSSIKGFRAPFLNYSVDTLTQLHSDGFLYDSSATSASPADAAGTDAYWPYTLDAGFANDCLNVDGLCNGALKLPGMWEIPLYATFDERGPAGIHLMDPWLDAPTSTDTLSWLQSTFLTHYNGNRQPFGLYTHPIHLAVGYPGVTDPIATRAMVNQFLDWAQGYPNVWIVTNQQLLAWMQNPTTIPNLAQTKALGCSTPNVDPSLKICNGIQANEQGLLLNCPFVDFPWTTCYGCPVNQPSPAEPVPAQNTTIGVRSHISANCSTPFWDPIGNTCHCTSASCAFTDNTLPITSASTGAAPGSNGSTPGSGGNGSGSSSSGSSSAAQKPSAAGSLRPAVGAVALAGGVVAAMGAAGYSCDASTCRLPACMCASVNPPGGLSPADVPQFITFTADDALEVYTTEAVNHFLAQRKNPNGCTPKATWFLSLNYTNFSMVTDFYVAGNEIADHTMTHVGQPPPAEILGNLAAVNAFSGIPVSSIKGFRTPFLNFSADTLTQLHSSGFLYDSSATSTSPANAADTDAVWPYTLDAGFANDCLQTTGICGGKVKLPGLWEIPLYSIFDTTGPAGIHLMDPWLDSTNTADVLAWMQASFLTHYNGNRQPFGLYSHPIHLAVGYPGVTDPVATRAMINQFLDWAQGYPNVWIVTNQQLLSWMQHPVTNANIAQSTGLGCSTPSVAPSLKICNGIQANEQGLLLNCPFVDFPWTTCYGCPVTQPSPANPVPAQNTTIGVRAHLSGNCSTPFWDPVGNTCHCTNSNCAFTDDTGPIGNYTAGLNGGGTNTTSSPAPSSTKSAAGLSFAVPKGVGGFVALGLAASVALVAA